MEGRRYSGCPHPPKKKRQGRSAQAIALEIAGRAVSAITPEPRMEEAQNRAQHRWHIFSPLVAIGETT